MNRQTRNQIAGSLLRLKKIIELRFLQNKGNTTSPFYTSVFIESLIHLNHLIVVVTDEKNGFEPVDLFNDDIPVFDTGKEINSYHEIKSLVRYMRNAACHADSDKRKTKGDLYFAFLFQTVDNRNSHIGEIHCKYEDDIAAIFGDHYIYINRHIVRAYNIIYPIIISDNRFGLYKKFVEVILEGNK